MGNTVERTTMKKVSARLIPFTMLLFLVNYVDRANISFAALQMPKDLGFTATVYGLGAGIFFIGYFIFEIPSNLALHRVGARRWIAMLTVVWGAVAAAMALVSGKGSFYGLRFLLGAAEAGFLPGIMLYFSYWFPARDRAKAMAIFMASIPLANIVSAPLSLSLMQLHGYGLRGWQVMFMLEGLPAVVLGFIVFKYLTERPADAQWLDSAERQWLTETIATERAALEKRGALTLRRGLSDTRVLLIAICGFCFSCGNFGIVFWLPQIVKSLAKFSNAQIGLLTALPYILGTPCMILWGRHSDRSGDRKWHLALSCLVASFGLAAAGLSGSPAWSYVGLCTATIGILSLFGVYWAMPAELLKGIAAAGGLALINSVCSLGGFLGPYLIGFVRDKTHSFAGSLLVMSGFVLLAAILATLLSSKKPEKVDGRITVAVAYEK